jgi:hypothetical protein
MLHKVNFYDDIIVALSFFIYGFIDSAITHKTTTCGCFFLGLTAIIIMFFGQLKLDGDVNNLKKFVGALDTGLK